MILAPGVVQVPTTRRDNAFLVEGEDGYTLVDVGWKGSVAVLREALPRLGDIKRIVITHAHPDHVRGLAAFRAATGATVLIHGLDAPWLAAGRVPREGRSGAFGRAIDKLPLLQWTPVEADVLLAGDEVIDGLRVIHTPGHSPGHIVLFHEATHTLLTGDAVVHRGGAVKAGPDALAQDPALRDASLSRIPLDARQIGFAHGEALTGAAAEEFHARLTALSTPRPR